MPTITNPETPPPAAPAAAQVGADEVQDVAQQTPQLAALLQWNRMSPHEQLAFWMSVLASDPQLRDAFRRAIRVRGIPESQQDSRRVISAEEFMRAAQDTARKAGVMLT